MNNMAEQRQTQINQFPLAILKAKATLEPALAVGLWVSPCHPVNFIKSHSFEGVI